MNSNAANLWSVFGHDALLDPFPYIEKIFTAIKHRRVETVVYHAPYELAKYTLFQPDVGGFGRFAYLRTGERIFVRIRSYFGKTEVYGRAVIPIQYGERREITICVTTIGSPLIEGTLKVIIAEWMTNEAPDTSFGAPTLATRAPSQGSYGNSVVPCVLLDSFVGKNKKVAAMGGYEVLVSGSATVIEAYDNIRKIALKTSVQRGPINTHFAEWVVKVEKRTKSNRSLLYECDGSMLNALHAKSAVKINRRIEERNAHPNNEVEPDPVTTFSDAVRTANHFFELGTLGAMIDLIARDAFKGVKLPVFSVPIKFPLYLCACIFLSASPEIARLPNTGRSNAEDASNATMLIEMYRSLTVGTDRSTGARTSAFEAILSVACDGVGALTSKPTKASNGSVKSIYSRTEKDNMPSVEEVLHVPYAIENMRRQGAALLQELFGNFTTETVLWADAKQTALLGKDAAGAALDATSSRLVEISKTQRRRATGCTGSSAMWAARATRSSTREAMQRVVLQTMLELNEFATSGTFQLTRYAALNSESDEAIMGLHSGIQRNVDACQWLHSELLYYFSSGVHGLITAGIPTSFAIRYDTVVQCGDCGKAFDPLWVTPRDNIATCEGCNVLFCMICYNTRVTNMINANGGNSPTEETMERHVNLRRCAQCVRT